jgi:predicted nucleic-acid-binding Zn-ribbon protein
MSKTPPSQSPQERIQRGLDELKRRGIKCDNCPRCNTAEMNVDLIEMSARSAGPIPSGLPFPRSSTYDQVGGFIPLLNFVCKNCGYVMFHDLNVLGV